MWNTNAEVKETPLLDDLSCSFVFPKSISKSFIVHYIVDESQGLQLYYETQTLSFQAVWSLTLHLVVVSWYSVLTTDKTSHKCITVVQRCICDITKGRSHVILNLYPVILLISVSVRADHIQIIGHDSSKTFMVMVRLVNALWSRCSEFLIVQAMCPN